MVRKSAGKKLIVLFAALCVLVIFACVSVSKFVLTDKKELVGVYTDFVLSHDGDGQTAVIKRDADGGVSGYIAVTVSNFTAEKVSKRDVKFSLRAPTAQEVSNGYVVDAWGEKHVVSKESRNYEVTIVDENEEAVTDDSEVTLLKANVRNSSAMLLKIRRNADDILGEGSEQLSIILQTDRPYKDLQVFTVNTTMARLSVGVSSDVYNGYTRETVNLKSATEFVKNGGYITGASYLAEVSFTLSGDVTFDMVRFTETYGDAPKCNARYLDGKYIITIRAGADVNLYFYVGGSGSVTVSAKIDDGNAAGGEEKVSGVQDDNVVFAR